MCKSVFLNVTSVSHPGDVISSDEVSSSFLPPYEAEPLFSPSFYSVPVVYAPVKQNKKRRK